MFFWNKSITDILVQQMSFLSYTELIRQSQLKVFIVYSLAIIDLLLRYNLNIITIACVTTMKLLELSYFYKPIIDVSFQHICYWQVTSLNSVLACEFNKSAIDVA